MKTFTITVIGRVQGVNFRRFIREKAAELGLTGTVENLPDGNVSIVATGSDHGLEILVEHSKKGSAASKVDHVIIGEVPIKHFEDFQIIRK